MDDLFKTNRVCPLNLRKIPIDLKTAFKAYCVKQDISMNDAVIELMRDALKYERKL